MKNTIILLSLAFVIVLTSGCGEKKPDGMPKLVPTTITVTQDGKPLADATVSLTPVDESAARWTASGISDSSGLVALKVLSKYPGAMQGKHKVTISKIVEDESTKKEIKDVDGKVERIQVDCFETIADAFTSYQTTELEVEVGPGTNALTADCGKAVRKKLSDKSVGE